MKLKEFGSQGEHATLTPPLDPPMPPLRDVILVKITLTLTLRMF